MSSLAKLFKKLFSKTFLVILMIVVGFCMFFYWGWFEKQYDKCVGMYYVYRGDSEYKKENLQKAIDYYVQGLNLYPEHYEAWYNLGNIYVDYEDYYSAADAYEKAIDYNPKYTIARMNLGIISTEKLGNFNEAITQYDTIIGTRKHLWFIPFIFSNLKSEKINRGLAYYNMGVAYREKALYIDKNKEHSYEYLMKSIQAYKNAARILKKDYDTRYNLAIVYQLAGDYQNAGINYCKAIELKPMNYEAHYNLAVLLRHLRMYKEAYNEIEKAGILVTNGDVNPNISTYIFDVLNDVSRTLVVNDDYKYLIENFDNAQVTKNITYVNGKIVATDALDRAMLENFKTCETEKFFVEYQ